MCSRCFILPPFHPPSFPWPAPLVPIASPFPRRPSPAALALQRSPRRSRSSLELEQSRCTGAALAGSCLAKPSSHECPPRTDHPTRSGHRVSPCSPMSKHGAAGVTHGAYTSMPQHPRRVPRHTQTLWWHPWPIPVRVSCQNVRYRQRVMAWVSSVPLKPLRFMHALKCFAKSTPPRWGWDSSH